MVVPTSKGSVAQVNGIELGYQMFGEGTPLVLLHGGYGSAEMFGSNVELLAADRRVIAVDLQSHGRSPATDRPMRFETMAEDVAALIDELGLERAAIMGFSLGGAVGLRVAIQHPEIVERVVLVSTVFRRNGWYPEMTAQMDAMGPATADHLRQTPLYKTYEQIAPNVDGWPVLVHQVSEVVKIDYDWSPEIPGLAMPVMLVIGDADGLPPPSRGRVLLAPRRRPARRRLGPIRHDASPARNPPGRDALRHQRVSHAQHHSQAVSQRQRLGRPTDLGLSTIWIAL